MSAQSVFGAPPCVLRAIENLVFATNSACADYQQRVQGAEVQLLAMAKRHAAERAAAAAASAGAEREEWAARAASERAASRTALAVYKADAAEAAAARAAAEEEAAAARARAERAEAEAAAARTSRALAEADADVAREERDAARAEATALLAELEAARADAKGSRDRSRRAEADAAAKAERKVKTAARAAAEEATLSSGLVAEMTRLKASEKGTRCALEQMLRKHEELSQAYGALMTLKPTVEAMTDYLIAHFAGFEKVMRGREAGAVVGFCVDWLKAYRNGEMAHYVASRVARAMDADFDKAVRNTRACGASPPTRAEFDEMVGFKEGKLQWDLK